MPTLYMETTKIPPQRTAGEIQELLMQAGARQIILDFEPGPNPELRGIYFVIPSNGVDTSFALPARVEPVYQHLLKKISPRNRPKKEKDVRDQSKRVAWRQLLRWIEAQVAMIETGMVEPAEVFLPYAVVSGSSRKPVTLFEAMTSQGKLALPAPEAHRK